MKIRLHLVLSFAVLSAAHAEEPSVPVSLGGGLLPYYLQGFEAALTGGADKLIAPGRGAPLLGNIEIFTMNGHRRFQAYSEGYQRGKAILPSTR